MSRQPGNSGRRRPEQIDLIDAIRKSVEAENSARKAAKIRKVTPKQSFPAEWENVVVQIIPKNSREEYRICFAQRPSGPVVSMRGFIRKLGGEYMATRSGFTCRLDLVPALYQALMKVESVTKSNGIWPINTANPSATSHEDRELPPDTLK